ncbi:MAG: hypothetical protein GY820_47150 [Gammaproteobacteria bacterium]|nr:hypothetical protein [Gammaproteobacteria bacterium]
MNECLACAGQTSVEQSLEAQKIADISSNSSQEGDEDDKSKGSRFVSAEEGEESSGDEANSTLLLAPVHSSLTVSSTHSKMADMDQMKAFFTDFMTKSEEKRDEKRRIERENERADRE